jgi:hypothetical protein
MPAETLPECGTLPEWLYPPPGGWTAGPVRPLGGHRHDDQAGETAAAGARHGGTERSGELPHEIAAYEAAWDGLVGEALGPDESSRLFRTMANDLERKQ